MRGTREPVGGVLLTLWRAAAGFRVIALAFCLYLIYRWHDLYARPEVAYAAAAGMSIMTAAVVLFGTSGRAQRHAFVLGDVLGCIGLTLLSRLAQHPRQYHGGMPTLTTVWAAGPAIEVGLLLGAAAGGLAGLLQLIASMLVRGGYDGRTLVNGLLLIIVGAVAGYLSRVTVQVERERDQMATEAARRAERDRLVRSIHDGVLQTLALVHRRGEAAGGDWAELARDAAVQEAALRTLISSEPTVVPPAGSRDLSAELIMLRSAQVTVSVAQAPTELASAVCEEIVDAVRAALRNVEQHAGSGAHAWVLLEDLGAELVITVRDDGVGIAEGRLGQAARQGRLGVAKSLRGRIADLGGRVEITSRPNDGTEVEIVVPLPDTHR